MNQTQKLGSIIWTGPWIRHLTNTHVESHSEFWELWGLGSGNYPCFIYAFFFFQKKTLKTQDFPKLMNYQSKSIFSLTYIIINLCIDFICWNKLTWNTCWRNGTRPRLVASNRRAYRGRRWAPRDAREMWRSMRGEWRLCGVALLPLAACRAWCANSWAQRCFSSSRQVINGSRQILRKKEKEPK